MGLTAAGILTGGILLGGCGGSSNLPVGMHIVVNPDYIRNSHIETRNLYRHVEKTPSGYKVEEQHVNNGKLSSMITFERKNSDSFLEEIVCTGEDIGIKPVEKNVWVDYLSDGSLDKYYHYIGDNKMSDLLLDSNSTGDYFGKMQKEYIEKLQSLYLLVSCDTEYKPIPNK
jgi:hypothetical protein